jgi:DNA-binding transcriptional MerR regulator
MTIGELAREAAVSTRTLRFWADEGLVPCGRTESGYRSFGPEALPVAGLIRVLRELDVDLPTIRSILEGRRDLAHVVATHVDVIDARIAQLRFQRSVLRAVANVHRPTSQELQIMYDLANLTADQRRRIITDLIDETFAGLDDPGPVAERMRTATPDLPEDPSAEQVAAWVELAQLVEDPSFRARVREMAVAGGPADGDHAAFGAAVDEHAAPAHAAGVDPTSAEAAEVVARVLAASSGPGTDRAALADRIARFTDARVERYWALLAIINGWPAWPPQVPVYEWFTAALRA